MAQSQQKVEEVVCKDEGGYEPLELKVCKAVGKMRWSPAWEIHFHYSHFDQELADGNGLFIDRQVDAKSFLPEMPLITRESPGIDENPTGCHVSLASLPPRDEEPQGGEIYNRSDSRTAHQRDWDALVQWRDELFEKHGVSKNTPVLDKIRILAEHASSRGGESYVSRHPVDLFLHGSYCVGKANGLAAMLHTMGVPARIIHTVEHSVVEAYVDGQWFMADNVQSDALLMRTSAMEAFADPAGLKQPLTNEQWGYYKELHSNSPYNLSAWWHWHFNQSGCGVDLSKESLLNGIGVSICLDPSTAKALYPNAKRHLFKVLKGNPPVLVSCRKQSWYRASLRVLEGQWVRKRFYVGELHDSRNPLRKIVGVLHLMGGEAQTIDTEKADWILKINGKPHHLKDYEGWHIRREFDQLMMPQLTFEFQIPLSELRERAYNTLELGTEEPRPRGLNQFLHVLVYPDPLLPYLCPFKTGNQYRQTHWHIGPDHGPELRQVGGFEK